MRAVLCAVLCAATWSLRRPMLAAEHRPHMRLVVCNAVADDAPIAVRQNGGSRLLSGLAYQTCAEAGGLIAENDELEFLSPTAGAWTFQVGPLPSGAGGLLLVFEQESHHHPGFRAVAFPEVSELGAQVAVLDVLHVRRGSREEAAAARKPRPSLRMRTAGAPTGTQPETIALDGTSLGTADLEFDHVYNLDAGDFEVSLADLESEVDAVDGAEVAPRIPAQLHAQPGQSYVVLRTGRPDLGYPEQLLVFSALASCAPALLGLLPLALAA